jgi:hypothetical protein
MGGRGAEIPDRVAVGDFSSRADWVESDRRGQALVEMTVAGRAGLTLRRVHVHAHLTAFNLNAPVTCERLPLAQDLRSVDAALRHSRRRYHAQAQTGASSKGTASNGGAQTTASP